MLSYFLNYIYVWISTLFIYSLQNSLLKLLRSSNLDFADARGCYEPLSFEKYQIALSINEIFSNLPKYLVIKALAEWAKDNENMYTENATYQMQLTNNKCKSTLEFSSPQEFKYMNIKFKFHLGYNTSAFTSVEVKIYPKIEEDEYYFVDIYGIIGLYVSYKKKGNNIFKKIKKLSYKDFKLVIDSKFFAKSYICVADQHYMYTLKPVFDYFVINIPPYQSITVRYYISASQTSMAELPAWPCDSDPLYTTNKVHYAIPDYPSNGQVLFTFNEITYRKKFLKPISLSSVREGLYFDVRNILISNIDEDLVSPLDPYTIRIFIRVIKDLECSKLYDTKVYTVYCHNNPVGSFKRIVEGHLKYFENYRYEAMSGLRPCS